MNIWDMKFLVGLAIGIALAWVLPKKPRWADHRVRLILLVFGVLLFTVSYFVR